MTIAEAVLAGAPQPAPAAAPLVQVRGLGVRFGGIVALDDVSFDVRRGEVCGLIGPNGAGKSTFFNCLSGLYTPTSGSITVDGVDLATCQRHERTALGIGRTFQNLALFHRMTVRENILVGTQARRRSGFLRDCLRLPSALRLESASQQAADALIELLSLQAVADRVVADLPFGTQKRTELARALACEPALLLLDEPACGLNHEELEELRETVLQVRRRFDLTVLLVEHHMGLVMSMCDRIVVLDFGRKIAEGLPAEVRADPLVIRAYLGADAEEAATC